MDRWLAAHELVLDWLNNDTAWQSLDEFLRSNSDLFPNVPTSVNRELPDELQLALTVNFAIYTKPEYGTRPLMIHLPNASDMTGSYMTLLGRIANNERQEQWNRELDSFRLLVVDKLQKQASKEWKNVLQKHKTLRHYINGLRPERQRLFELLFVSTALIDIQGGTTWELWNKFSTVSQPIVVAQDIIDKYEEHLKQANTDIDEIFGNAQALSLNWCSDNYTGTRIQWAMVPLMNTVTTERAALFRLLRKEAPSSALASHIKDIIPAAPPEPRAAREPRRKQTESVEPQQTESVEPQQTEQQPRPKQKPKSKEQREQEQEKVEEEEFRLEEEQLQREADQEQEEEEETAEEERPDVSLLPLRRSQRLRGALSEVPKPVKQQPKKAAAKVAAAPKPKLRDEEKEHRALMRQHQDQLQAAARARRAQEREEARQREREEQELERVRQQQEEQEREARRRRPKVTVIRGQPKPPTVVRLGQKKLPDMDLDLDQDLLQSLTQEEAEEAEREPDLGLDQDLNMPDWLANASPPLSPVLHANYSPVAVTTIDLDRPGLTTTTTTATTTAPLTAAAAAARGEEEQERAEEHPDVRPLVARIDDNPQTTAAELGERPQWLDDVVAMKTREAQRALAGVTESRRSRRLGARGVRYGRRADLSAATSDSNVRWFNNRQSRQQWMEQTDRQQLEPRRLMKMYELVRDLVDFGHASNTSLRTFCSQPSLKFTEQGRHYKLTRNTKQLDVIWQEVKNLMKAMTEEQAEAPNMRYSALTKYDFCDMIYRVA